MSRVEVAAQLWPGFDGADLPASIGRTDLQPTAALLLWITPTHARPLPEKLEQSGYMYASKDLARDS